MPLNPAIALAARPVEIADPMAMYGKIAAIQQAQNQNALAQRQMQEYDRSLQESEGIRNRLAGGAKIDDPETYNFLLGSKTGREILKQEVDLQKERTLQQKTEGELFDQRMKQIRELWGNVQTPEQAMAVHEATHLDPIVGKRLAAWNMTEQSGRQSILDAAKDPLSFAQFVKRAQLGAEKFMELNKPTLSTKDTGGELIDRTYEPLTGKITEVSRTAKVMSPAERAANVRAQAAQNLAERRFAYERENPGYTVQAQSDGTLVAINNRNPSDVKPVSMGGAPVQKGGANITEGERKAATLLTRLRGSAAQLNAAIEKAPNASAPGVLSEGVRATFGDTPANLLTGEDRQRVEAAQLDLLDAALTLGTGAAYTKEQLRGYARSYFPQIFDKPANIEDKKKRLATLIESAEIAAGRAANQVPKTFNSSSKTGTWSVVK